MKRDWSADDLAEHWTLLPNERELLANKTGATRLGLNWNEGTKSEIGIFATRDG